MNQRERIPCTACGSGRWETLLERKEQPVSVHWKDFQAIPEMDAAFAYCRDCGHVFLATAFTTPAYAATVARLYMSYDLLDYSVRPFPQRDEHYLGAVKYLLGHAPESGFRSVLEIGSNRGDFLYLIKEALPHTNVLGVEPSKLGFYGVPTVNCLFGSCDILGEFDCIACRHVLEHLMDPLDLLRKVADMLPDTGLLLLEVPNMHHDMSRQIECFILEHVQYFSERSLCTLLKRAGLEAVHLDSGHPEGLRLIVRKSGAEETSLSPKPLSRRDVNAYIRNVEGLANNFITRVQQGARPAFYGFGNIFFCVLAEILKRMPMTELLNKGAVILDDTPSKIGRTFRGMSILSPEEGLAGSECAVMVCTMNPTHRGNMRAKVLDMAPGTEVLTPWEIGHD